MRLIQRHCFRRRSLVIGFCLSTLAGLGLARVGLAVVMGWLVVPGLAATVFLPKKGLMAMIAMAAFGFCFGCARGTQFIHKLGQYQALEHSKIELVVTADEDAIYGTSKQLTFVASHVRAGSGNNLAGKIKVSGFGENAIFQGDVVRVEGKLYNSRGSQQASISFATLTVIAHHPSPIADVRRRFTAGMQTALPEPLAPFAMGLLIGQRDTLPDSVKQDLLMVGLTHIIAVSGYNLTIILQASRNLLSKRSKRLSVCLSLSLIGIFLLLAGASASIVRAAIVSVLSIAATYYGRQFRPINLLLLAAAVTAWANPFYLWSDLSWYLSFLAFFGVMILAPLIQSRFPGRWHGSIVVAVALESACAEVMSLPFILHEFGQMSFIGLPANVLVVSLVPLAMLLSLIAGLAGMFSASLCGWLAWPATILLNYMLDVAHFMARIPHVFIQNRSLSLIAMLALYVLVISIILILNHKTKRPKGDTITDRNVWSQQMVND